MKNEDSPLFVSLYYNCRPILTNCVDFDRICLNFYTASNIKDLFHDIQANNLVYVTCHWYC